MQNNNLKFEFKPFIYFAKIVMESGEMQIYTSSEEGKSEGIVRPLYEKFGKVKSYTEITKYEFSSLVKELGCDYPEDYPIENF